MRKNATIFNIWDSGQFVGANRPNGVVTVEKDWWLNKTGKSVGLGKRGPYRWYQKEDNSQVETVLENVSSIEIDRSIDTDAATCVIKIVNSKLDGVSGRGMIGDRGYYTWCRGKSADSVARWNHSTNEWEDVIAPNALLRTYQGFGGFNKTLSDAVSDGNLMLTGVWLVDSVNVSSNGLINIKCRDMAKLLIEQPIMRPLIPNSLYPLRYCKWYYEDYDASFDPRPPANPPAGPANIIVPKWAWGSQDSWYGYNANIHGHRGTDSLDGNMNTFALSVGNSHPSKLFCADYFEYEYNGPIEQVFVHPWGGNYTMYVHVKENGVWQGVDRVPYSETELCATQRCVDTGADEIYVMKTSVPWETGKWYKLPRRFQAERVRITFRDHTQSQWGPWFYRCGIREFKVGYGVRETPKGISHIPWTFGITPNRGGAGYWVVDESGAVFPFGDAREYSQTGGGEHDSFAVAIESTPSGKGYWVLLRNGRVLSYGDAQHYGDQVSMGWNDWISFAPTRTGQGYYLLRRDGYVRHYGDAGFYGHATKTTSNPAAYSGTAIETHPTLDGYWIVDGDGVVEAFGDVPHWGSWPGRTDMKTHEWVHAFRRTKDGNGYWIAGGSGTVKAFGNAGDYGSIADGVTRDLYSGEDSYRKVVWGIAPSEFDLGFVLLQADGTLLTVGEDPGFYGNPGGTGILRKPGNYDDYADIVKELLLWSGFHLYDAANQNNADPIVYGNIETTGAFADECLSEDIFDKKPVIDGINTLKEIVGYLFYVDDEGAARFESPNWWRSGNFYDDGSHTNFIPEIDERLQLTEYTVNDADKQLRSEIVIATEDPDSNFDSTIVTKVEPYGLDRLKGMVKPAMWVNGVFKNEDEQRIMAELISLHIWFSTRVGSVTCVANPAIQINDQVRIWERVTAETYIHYVRGIRTTMNLKSGSYTMTLDTNWLGTADNWVITSDNVSAPDLNSGSVYKISSNLVDWLENSGSRSIAVARSSGFKRSYEPTFKHADTIITSSSPGAADG